MIHLKRTGLALLLVVALASFSVFKETYAAEPSLTDAGTPGIATGGGVQYLSPVELTEYMDGLAAVNAKWVRFDFAWSDIQATDSATFSWAKYDAVVAAAKARNIEVLGMIGYTPAWARPAGCNNDKCHPNDPAQFATFVGQTVDRYKAEGVTNWEIWNEPNIETFWQPAPNVAQYSELLQQSYITAKAADPTALVLNGGFSPAESNGTNIAPTDFLSGLYSSGAGAYFDAVAHHPYCFSGTFDCPSTYAPWSAWSQMSETPVNMRDIMTANGDSFKKIWVTEFGAPTKGSASVSEAQQATMLNNAYAILQSKPWAGPLFWYSYKDAGTNKKDREDWFGFIRYNGTHKPAYDTYMGLSATPPTEQPVEPVPAPEPTVPPGKSKKNNAKNTRQVKTSLQSPSKLLHYI